MSTDTDGNAPATLRALLEILCSVHDAEITQHGRVVGWRTQDGLLVQLSKARAANITGSGGGSTAHHERVTLNIGAAELHATIERRIRSWAIRTGYQPRTRWPDLGPLLTAWHAHVYLNRDFQPERYIPILAGWIAQITDLIIDPPRQWTPTDVDGRYRPCPICHERWAHVDIGGEQNRIPALNIVERDPADRSVLTCRNCRTTWEGLGALQELADEMGASSTPTPQEIDA